MTKTRKVFGPLLPFIGWGEIKEAGVEALAEDLPDMFEEDRRYKAFHFEWLGRITVYLPSVEEIGTEV